MNFKNKIKVAPSILSADYADLKNEIEKAYEPVNDYIEESIIIINKINVFILNKKVSIADYICLVLPNGNLCKIFLNMPYRIDIHSLRVYNKSVKQNLYIFR